MKVIIVLKFSSSEINKLLQGIGEYSESDFDPWKYCG